jgi:hypothetical protein
MAYQKEADHHVHAAAKGRVEAGLVHRDHPLAAGLFGESVSISSIQFRCLRANCCDCHPSRWFSLRPRHILKLLHP